MPGQPSLSAFANVTTASTVTLDSNFTNISNLLGSANNYCNYLADTGSVNQYVVNFPAGVTALLVAGLSITFKPANTNTTSSTLNANSTGVKNIVRRDGSAVQSGDVQGICTVVYDGTNYVLQSSYSSAGGTFVPVRQAVLSGTLDANGLPNFGGSTGSTTVTMSGSLIATAANGFNNSGQVDSVGNGNNLSWTGLSTNGTMYLYVTIAGGVLTTASTTLQPVYEWGGTPSTTNNQLTFNIQAMTGYLGNGSTVPQTNWVMIGEVTVAGGVVTAIIWYQLMRRYKSAVTATLPGAAVTTNFNHNIGITPSAFMKAPQFVAINTTTEFGFSVGDVVRVSVYGNGPYDPCSITGRNTLAAQSGSSGWVVAAKPAGSGASPLTAANWSYWVTLDTGW